jgi:phosphate transport system ATP-binding protein
MDEVNEEQQPGLPPPIKRIVVERAPRVVGPSPSSNGVSPGVAPAPGAPAVSAAPGASGAVPGLARHVAPGRETVERMRIEDLTVSYDAKEAVSSVTLPVRQGEVLGLIGPSGCGKTTLLRSLNRLTELTASASWSGQILLDGEDVHELDVTFVRRRVTMVFQQPNPFPMSIFDNVAYGLREQGSKRPGRSQIEPAVIDALRRAGLYDEVAEDLGKSALRLSGGQQQRLCIARALAVRPEVLLLDEPCSALDPISTATIEDLVVRLRDEVAVVIVTHNLQQAFRVADRVGFMFLGELVEYGEADQVFGHPRAQRTQDYVAGAFG